MFRRKITGNIINYFGGNEISKTQKIDDDFRYLYELDMHRLNTICNEWNIIYYNVVIEFEYKGFKKHYITNELLLKKTINIGSEVTLIYNTIKKEIVEIY